MKKSKDKMKEDINEGNEGGLVKVPLARTFVVIKTRAAPERNASMVLSLSFASMSAPEKICEMKRGNGEEWVCVESVREKTVEGGKKEKTKV